LQAVNQANSVVEYILAGAKTILQQPRADR
jgi:hypothetical protein